MDSSLRSFKMIRMVMDNETSKEVSEEMPCINPILQEALENDVLIENYSNSELDGMSSLENLENQVNVDKCPEQTDSEWIGSVENDLVILTTLEPVRFDEPVSLPNVIDTETEQTIPDMNKDTNKETSDYQENKENIEYEMESEENTNDEQDFTREDSANQSHEKRKRRKRRHVDEKDWFVNKNKSCKEKGNEYYGKKRTPDEKWDYRVLKEKKEMGGRCACKSSNEKGFLKFQCEIFSEIDRSQIFTEFWRLDRGEKKLYIRHHVSIEETQRQRGKSDSSKRKFAFYYHLRKAEALQRVCKYMFLNTLGVGEWTVLAWKKGDNMRNEGPEENKTEEGSNIKSDVRRSMFKARREALDDFFGALPKVESHYCRANSQKLYLEPLYDSKSHLYRFYADNWCKNRNIEPLSQTLFANVFDDLNLSLFTPKKDECKICIARKAQNLEEHVYITHQTKKNEARNEKEADKSSDVNKVYTMDLQSVLLAPKSNASTMYYKTKLIVHNFTVFDIKNKDGHCFIWNEVEGGVGANEFSTMISSFIESQVPLLEAHEMIILYSDGCCGQNRNSTLSNALLHTSIKHKITIIQKYLEPGHTQMEADAMHSTIERKLKNKIINVPADYIEVCKNARLKPRPYNVQYLDHSFFKDFSQLQYIKSIRPGKRIGDPTVQDIRALKYNPDGTIEYKLRHPDTWKYLPGRINAPKNVMEVLQNLYQERLPIKKIKYNDLQDLKQVITKDYHLFYDDIPHSE